MMKNPNPPDRIEKIIHVVLMVAINLVTWYGAVTLIRLWKGY